MKNKILVIVFIVIAAAIIWGGIVWSEKISTESRQAAEAQGRAAEEAQAKIMEKLSIKDVVVGTGPEAVSGDTVTVNYVGTLDNGTKFDSSYDRKQPFTFPLGAAKVIKGWDLGVPGMKVGGKRELTIPPELGYGSQAVGPIPANSTLHFTVELVSIQGK